MLTYNEVQNLLSSATFFYGDVTLSEIETVEQHKYMTEVDGTFYLGTNEEVLELASKAITVGPMKF